MTVARSTGAETARDSGRFLLRRGWRRACADRQLLPEVAGLLTQFILAVRYLSRLYDMALSVSGRRLRAGDGEPRQIAGDAMRNALGGLL